MAIRRVERELEAKLTLAETRGFFKKSGGKLERKWYADGTERLKISVRNLAAADGATVEITVADRPVATVSITGGSGRFDSDDGGHGSIPDMTVGETVEVRHAGAVVATGRLELD